MAPMFDLQISNSNLTQAETNEEAVGEATEPLSPSSPDKVSKAPNSPQKSKDDASKESLKEGN